MTSMRAALCALVVVAIAPLEAVARPSYDEAEALCAKEAQSIGIAFEDCRFAVMKAFQWDCLPGSGGVRELIQCGEGAERRDNEKARKAHQRAQARARLPSPRIGMTTQEVIDGTSWGRPSRVNTTTTARGVSEQWVYRDREAYLYFENGKLTSIQTSR